MKSKKSADNLKGKHEAMNSKHLQSGAKNLSAKHPRGNFFGNHRWFPYNIHEE